MRIIVNRKIVFNTWMKILCSWWRLEVWPVPLKSILLFAMYLNICILYSFCWALRTFWAGSPDSRGRGRASGSVVTLPCSGSTLRQLVVSTVSSANGIVEVTLRTSCKNQRQRFPDQICNHLLLESSFQYITTLIPMKINQDVEYPVRWMVV